MQPARLRFRWMQFHCREVPFITCRGVRESAAAFLHKKRALLVDERRLII